MNANQVLGVGAFALRTAVLPDGCEEDVVAEKNTVRPVRAMKVNDGAALQRRIFAGRAKATRAPAERLFSKKPDFRV